MKINNKNSVKDTTEEKHLNDMQFFFQFYLSPHLTVPRMKLGWVQDWKSMW